MAHITVLQRSFVVTMTFFVTVISFFQSYGHIDEFRQGDIMKSFGNAPIDENSDEAETLKQIASLVNRKKVV